MHDLEMTSYFPLEVRPRDELPISRGTNRTGTSVFARIYAYLTSIYRTPHGRRSIERQLAMRNEFPVTQWKEAGYEAVEVEVILNIIRKELRLPNHHFIPADPLRVLLVGEFVADFPADSVRLGIRETLGVNYTSNEVFAMETWTVVDLVNDIKQRVAREPD